MTSNGSLLHRPQDHDLTSMRHQHIYWHACKIKKTVHARGVLSVVGQGPYRDPKISNGPSHIFMILSHRCVLHLMCHNFCAFAAAQVLFVIHEGKNWAEVRSSTCMFGQLFGTFEEAKPKQRTN